MHATFNPGQVLDESAEQEHGTDRNNEGFDLTVYIEVTVNGSDCCACHDATHDGQRDAGLGKHTYHDGCNTQDRALGEIQTAHGHDEEYTSCRDHGHIYL